VELATQDVERPLEKLFAGDPFINAMPSLGLCGRAITSQQTNQRALQRSHVSLFKKSPVLRVFLPNSG
jgi:hypothetical protein